MAEADGNRTRLAELLDHVGFEDRGGHQAPSRLLRSALNHSHLLRGAQAATSLRCRRPCDATTWPPLATAGVVQDPPTITLPIRWGALLGWLLGPGQ